MVDPVPDKARIRDILQRMYEWVDEVLDSYYSEYFITTNFSYDISNVPTFPAVVIAISPSEMQDPVYGRYTPSKGSLISNDFTLYLYQQYDSTSSEDNYRDAQILVRRITDYLTTKNQNTIEMSTHGIWAVSISNIRPSETGIQEIARYVVNVTVESIRGDSH